jgi:hypothetical protein
MLESEGMTTKADKAVVNDALEADNSDLQTAI